METHVVVGVDRFELCRSGVAQDGWTEEAERYQALEAEPEVFGGGLDLEIDEPRTPVLDCL